jgi:hypothetical protein
VWGAAGVAPAEKRRGVCGRAHEGGGRRGGVGWRGAVVAGSGSEQRGVARRRGAV